MIDTITWVLPRPRRANKYKGGFPQHFEKKLIRILGFDETDKFAILHPFGGMSEFGIRLDLNDETSPDIFADAHCLPFPDNSFDLVILDPPYDNEQSIKLYNTGKIKYGEYISEARRVCKSMGYIAVYHWVMTPRPDGMAYHKRIVVLTRVWHRPRVCCVFQKR